MRPTSLVTTLVTALAGVIALAFWPARSSAASLPYVTEPAFDLKFDQPVAIVSAPGETNRLFIVEKPGRIVVVPDLAKPTRTVFLDVTEQVGNADGEQGLLALAFHPDYRRNGQFYIWYTSHVRTAGGRPRQDRLSRFTVSASDPQVADPASEQRLISQLDEAGNHNGGDLLFGPDGYLYVSLGDEGAADDSFRNSQRIDRDFFSGILRLDVDRRAGSLTPNPHPAVHANSFAVPPDNPFVGATSFNGQTIVPANLRSEFWATGLRNPFRLSLDPATGRIWCADVGQNQLEEINVITRGGNYGWNFREGNSEFRRGAPADAKFIGPVWEYPRSQGISVTGGIVSHGKRYPDLAGKYLFADFGFGHIWALTPDGDKPVGPDRVQTIATETSIAGFGRDPGNGDVLIASLNNSRILRLVPAKK